MEEKKSMPKRTYKLAGKIKRLDVRTPQGTIKVTNELLQNETVVAMLQQVAPKVFIAGQVVVA